MPPLPFTATSPARAGASRPESPLLAAAQRNLHATLPMAHLAVQALPQCPGIRLALINADFPTGALPAETMHAVIERPAYWAFCWGSGLGLARLLLDRPGWVRGKRVLDLGTGSGIVAIAACRAGAAHVIACDNDPHALAATHLNATLNGARLDTVSTLEAAGPVDLILLADVLYDRDNLPLLDALRERTAALLVADSRITHLPVTGFQRLATLHARTFPNLGEFDEFRTVRVFASGRISNNG